MMAKLGIPEKERQRIIEHVLAELSSGRAVSRILVEDDGMPAPRTFWNWHYSDENLMQKVARAREAGADAIMDETLGIADDGTNDWVVRRGGDGAGDTMVDHEHVSRSKLRVDTRHKYAQMIAPRKYGPKLDLTSGGEKLGLTAELEAARRRVAEGE